MADGIGRKRCGLLPLIWAALVAVGLLVAISVLASPCQANPVGPEPVAAHQADQGEGGWETHEEAESGNHLPEGYEIPPVWAAIPFVGMLLCIAILPLIDATEPWWQRNRDRLFVALVLSVFTLAYYWFVHPGVVDHHNGELVSGFAAVNLVLRQAVLAEYIPFIVLLFSLYVITGGIQLKGDLDPRPLTNVLFLAVGTAIASFIGTTGAAMLLIRPLLQANSQRRYVKHTVIFFIFLVCNLGGSLLPIGDPPLFLGYLKGVPFMWTLCLWPQWLAVAIVMLLIYFVWDCAAYKKESLVGLQRGAGEKAPLQLLGKINLLWLLGVVLSVALLVPNKPFLGWGPVVPNFFREVMQIIFVILSLVTTPLSGMIRRENNFNFTAILEVAALFIGIFITMQVPVEILQVKGASMGLTEPWHFFWATGVLSSFLDNAPTYIVFFETARTLPPSLDQVAGVATPLLAAISMGAVFMGGITYVGNGPNFMVKSIAEQAGVKMPSFFGYMVYSSAVLLPVFIVLTVVFNRVIGHWS